MSSHARSQLTLQLRELDAAFRNHGIRYAAIGGLAVNAHGFIRATRDIDLLVLVEDSEKVRRVALDLGYRILDDGKEIASYVRDLQRFDVMHAQRPISRDLLGRAVDADFDGMKLPIIPVEGLIGLKVQAYNDNPKRLQDVMDMVELFRINRQTLNMDEVRSYFRLFGRERLLDDILRAAR
jgi:predicted nucleotidyltransferase